MSSIEKPSFGAGVFVAVFGAGIFFGGHTSNAGDTWLAYSDQTSLRLIVRSEVGLNDVEEKDFAWGDVDHDGDVDLIVVRKEPFTVAGGKVNVLFLQEGVADGQAVDGVLVDRTNEFIPDFNDLTNDRDVLLADVNGDGWDDLITATTISDGLPKAISHPRIYLNLGMSGGQWQGYDFDPDRTPQLFTMVTNMPVAPRFCSIAAGDVDMDGDLDLYFGDYDGSGAGGAPQNPAVDLNDRLLLNDGNGNFTDSLQTRMTDVMLGSAFGMAVEMADMNNDGVVDIIKDTALNAPQYVSISYNDPDNPGFFSQFDRVYVEPAALPYHIDVGDLNNDGWLDIVVTEDDTDKFLLNQGTDASGMAQFSVPHLLQGSDNSFGGNNLIVDLDNDGFNDVIVTDVDVDQPGCSDLTKIFRNLANPPTVSLVDADGIQPWTPRGGHDVAVFDLTGDGFKDIIYGTCDGYEIWINQPASNLAFGFPTGLPFELTPNATTSFPVSVAGMNADPQPGTLQMFASIDGDAFGESDVTDVGGNQYVVELPRAECGSSVRFYFSGQTMTGGTFVDPAGAPENVYVADALYEREVIVDERFETDNAEWTVADTNVGAGSWVRVDPVQTNFGGSVAQPGDDFGDGAESMCYVTGQHFGGGSGSSDLDGGPTILTSPVIDLSGVENATFEYARWMFNNGANQDELVTEITNNGSDWDEVHVSTGTNGEWELVHFDVAGQVVPTADVQVRFRVADGAPSSLVEAGIDNFSVVKVVCEDSFEPEILQTMTAIPFELQSFGGFIDPRVESSNGSDINRGLDRLTVVFSEPVRNVGGGALSGSAFSVTETGDEASPNVAGIETDDDQTVVVLLDRIISPQEWTTVRADVEDMSGNPILVCDGCDTRPNMVSVAFLPGDIDQSGGVTPLDLFAYRQLVNGVSGPAVGTLSDLVDTNRDGTVNPVDLFAFRQLINGVGTSTRAWAGASLNSPQP